MFNVFLCLGSAGQEALSSQEQRNKAGRMVLPWAEGCDHSYYYKDSTSSFCLLNADSVSSIMGSILRALSPLLFMVTLKGRQHYLHFAAEEAEA